LKGQLDMKVVSSIRPLRYKKKNCMEIETPQRTYYFSADTRQLLTQWIDALNRSRDAINGVTPATSSPEAPAKAQISDFQALCVIGRGSFGKVLHLITL
jgi:hypothetical protein